MKRHRCCAIYTRKSTEEGLDQAFNSLEAQREACEAYIKSQVGEGWRLVRTHYDDGGISGGTMDRPALQSLLRDIEGGQVHVVLVYKVDRLTRSLSDFAKIVEIFETHDVSFVSVTQQFSTTSSMGRLTLNMLLSFAQFEREVTGERIRDKIAASKRKGMWIGGVVPLGYDAVDRKLIPNHDEEEIVRTLFQLYLELGNVTCVKEEADRLGLRTKARKPNNGRRCGGESFTRGHIYKVLKNPIYVGDVIHKGCRYKGEHVAIVDPETWHAVQAQLTDQAGSRRSGSNNSSLSPLMGRIFGEDGEPLVTTHAEKDGRRYRYYISKSLKVRSPDPNMGWRLPASEIESFVLNAICRLLQDRTRLVEVMGPTYIPSNRLKVILSRVAQLHDRMHESTPSEQRESLRMLVHRVEVRPELVRIHLSPVSLLGLLEDSHEKNTDPTTEQGKPLEVEIPVRFKRRGVETKLVVTNDPEWALDSNPLLISAIAQGRTWFKQLKAREVRSIQDLVKRHGTNRSDVSRILRLAFLAPDIVEAILEGRQPVDLTPTKLKRLPDLPVSWAEQRHLLGFSESTVDRHQP